jgi:hypothetical protein
VTHVSLGAGTGGQDRGMTRLRTLLASLALTCTVIGALGATATSAGGDPAAERYRAYSLLRERLLSCSLDRGWRHLSAPARRRCARLRRQYVLYSVSGESSQFFFRCRRSAPRCPAAPDGVRSPRAPVPRGATIFR